jgi:hypothetical protein
VQFGFYGMDPVYNVKPDGPWDRAQLLAWIARRIAEGSDHIKVFYEKWNGADVPSISAATLKALVQAAHERGLKVFVHNQAKKRPRILRAPAPTSTSRARPDRLEARRH